MSKLRQSMSSFLMALDPFFPSTLSHGNSTNKNNTLPTKKKKEEQKGKQHTNDQNDQLNFVPTILPMLLLKLKLL